MEPFLRGLRSLVEQMDIPIFDERHRVGDLRYALVRASRLKSAVHLTLVGAKPDPDWLGPLMKTLRSRYAALESGFYCTNATLGNTLLSGDIRRLFGPAGLLEKIGPRELESRPDAFLQANPDVATQLYAAAARSFRHTQPADIVDLYCGVGGLGLAVATPADRLLGIEASESAVSCARANARRAHLRGASFVSRPAAELLAACREAGMSAPDLLLTNPPRRGMGTAVVEQIRKLAPSRIVYVSCNPTTLRRDLDRLCAGGYELDRAQLFDMLPQTPHIETMAVLSRRAEAESSSEARS